MRLPLAANLQSRDGGLTRDARVQNALIEKVGENENGPVFDILSRPGMSDVGAVANAGTPQLLYPWNGLLHTIVNDALNRSSLATLRTYPTLNPSDKDAAVTLSNGNLSAASSAAYRAVRGTTGKAAGKWYWECVCAAGNDYVVGIGKATASLAGLVGNDANSYGFALGDGRKWNAGAGAAYTSAFAANTVVGFALDMAAGTLTIYNASTGVSQGVMFTGLTGTFFPMVSPNATLTVTMNFGASAFTGSVPAGYRAWDDATGLAVTNAGLLFDAQETNANAPSPRLMIKNHSQVWCVSNTGAVSLVGLPGTMGAWTAYASAQITRSGSTATFTYNPSTRPVQVGDSVTIAGATSAAYNGTFTVTAVNTSAYPYTFSYTVAGTPTTPDAASYPTYTVNGGMVRGIPYINGYFCMMDVNGVIWHSAADEPLSWSPTAFLTSRNENGAGVALGKSLNYLIAFKEWSTEFYYDAKNPTGSVFSPVENGFVRIGCASGDSLALVAAQLVWIGQTKAQGLGVYAMQGLNVRKISTEDVDRVISSANLSGVYAFGLNCKGHEMYFVTLTSINVTLVYDFTSDQWTTWTSLTLGTPVSVSSITMGGTTTATVTTSSPHGLSDGDPVKISGADQADYNGIFQIQYVSATVFTFQLTLAVNNATGTVTATPYTETYFKMVMAAVYQGTPLFLHVSDGHLYQLSASLYQDAGIPINVFCRTARIDGGNDDVKKMPTIRVICDAVSASTAMVRWSDDDAQTFQPYRLMDLTKDPCETSKCGTFRRRSLAFRHVNNATLRARALEVG